MSARDPFNGSPVQSIRRKAFCKVFVAGVDVTSKLEPFLVSVRIITKTRGTDSVVLELDDRDGRLQLPPLNAMMIAMLGWDAEAMTKIARTHVSEYESSFSRKEGGRRLHVLGYGTNMYDDGRSVINRTWGTGTPPGEKNGKMIKFEDVFKDAAKAGGYENVLIHNSFKGIERDFWQQIGMSFHHFGHSLARELGAYFHIDGDTVSLTKPGESPDGKALGTTVAEWGENLVSWRIRPYLARGDWYGIKAQYFDVQKGIWEMLERMRTDGVNTPDIQKAIYTLPMPTQNKQVGEQRLGGAPYEQQTSIGWAVINGEPAVHAGGFLQIKGARAGVDGLYFIHEAEHVYSRSGYLTRCQIERYVGPPAGSGGQN